MAESTELKPSLIGFPNEFPYEFDSPAFTSSANSTETEGESSDDEEDFLAGLTRRLSLSTQRVAPPSFTHDKSEGRVVASSPQSTLSGLGSWSASGSGSPNGPSSQMASPPTTPFLGNKVDTWDLIYKAAGEVARLKISGETQLNGLKCGHLNPFCPPRSSDPLVPHVQKTQNARFYSDHGEPQLYANTNLQEEAVKQQNSAWERQVKNSCFYWPAERKYQKLGSQLQRRNEFSGQEFGRYQRPLGLCQSDCPPPPLPQQLQQPRSAAMRGGYPIGSSVKRQCAGTGVFLPRRYANPSDSRKKPATACSPVLVPAKVVQALNCNSDDMTLPFASGFGGSYYDSLIARKHALMLQQRRSGLRPNQEMHLPQEWMY